MSPSLRQCSNHWSDASPVSDYLSFFLQIFESTEFSRTQLDSMFSIVELQKFLKVIGCTKSALFPNSEIHFENGWSQSFTPQKCPMKIKQEVHSFILELFIENM